MKKTLKKMHVLPATLAAAVSAIAISIPIISVEAATIRNVDAEVRAVTVTEKGVRSEKTVAPNATITTCANGCFVVFPNGEMLPLTGSEDVVIEKGIGKVLSK